MSVAGVRVVEFGTYEELESVAKPIVMVALCS